MNKSVKIVGILAMAYLVMGASYCSDTSNVYSGADSGPSEDNRVTQFGDLGDGNNIAIDSPTTTTIDNSDNSDNRTDDNRVDDNSDSSSTTTPPAA